MALRSARVAPLLAVALVTLSAATAAGADTLSGQRSELVREHAHHVEVKLDHGHASLIVKRTVVNGGRRHDEARFNLDVPRGAVATGLRTLAYVDGHERWYPAELMEAEAAAQRYQELTGIGGAYPKDPALLSWSRGGGLILQVFPVEPLGKKTVEYTLEIPMEYVNGKDVLHLPRMGTEDLEADVVVSSVDPRDSVLYEGRPLGAAAHLKSNADGVLELELARHDAPRLGGRMAVVPFAKDKTLVHTRLEVAAQLSQVPKNASVVVLLDSSRSMHGRQARAEVNAARAYLSHFPDAHAEVLTFDRVVHARNGGLVPVVRALSDLARLELTLKNGSQLDDALEAADKLLENAPGPRRIVLMSDRRTRAGLSPERLKTLLARSGAIVHVAQIEEGAPELVRDDTDEWAPLVKATGGLLWHATAAESTSDAVTMRNTYEEWARPVRIDHLFAQLDGGAIPGFEPPASLREGESFEDLRVDPARPTGVSLSGDLWATPIQAGLRPNAAQNRLWAALVFGSDVHQGLSDAEMMTLALAGRAVSPVTSYLAVEPGVRPSTEGLDNGTIGHGWGLGTGNGIGLGGRGSLGASERFDFVGYFRRELSVSWVRCGGGARKLELRIDTTGEEVVDVPSSEVTGAGGSSGVEKCMTEAAWDLDLPPEFTRQAYRSWTVKL